MKTKQATHKTIDGYIKEFPKDVQAILQRVRRTIKKAAPGAQETISYQIPTFTLHGKYLIYFAGYKKHIAIYPVPAGNAAFKKEMAPYIAGKGTLRFPLDKPIPLSLITKIVKVKLKENKAKAGAKAEKSK